MLAQRFQSNYLFTKIRKTVGMNNPIDQSQSNVQPVVFVVDDDPAVRESVEISLGPLQTPIECFESAEAFLSEWKFDRPGCLLLDVRMPGMSGIELHNKIAPCGDYLSVVIVTGHATVAMSTDAMKRGAFDFLQKPYPPNELRRTVTAGLEKAMDAWAKHTKREEYEAKRSTLSPRETEVYAKMLAGDETKKIAAELGISPSTVEKHRIAVIRKMGADNTLQLINQKYTAVGDESVTDKETP